MKVRVCGWIPFSLTGVLPASYIRTAGDLVSLTMNNSRMGERPPSPEIISTHTVNSPVVKLKGN